MKMSKYAQSSLEFIILVGFMTLLFMVFFSVVQESMGKAREERVERKMAELTDLVHQEIRNADRVHSGYIRVFYLPDTIEGNHYDISVNYNKELVLDSQGKQHVVFLDSPVYGNLTKGRNIIATDRGRVYLNTGPAPDLTIVVDGNISEWDVLGILPLEDNSETTNWYEDGQGDSVFAGDNYNELRNVYVTNDNDFLYLKIDFSNSSSNLFDNDNYIGQLSRYDLIVGIDIDSDNATGYSGRSESPGVDNAIPLEGMEYFFLDDTGTLSKKRTDAIKHNATVWDEPGLYEIWTTDSTVERTRDLDDYDLQDLVLVSSVGKSEHNVQFNKKSSNLNILPIYDGNETCFFLPVHSRINITAVGFGLNDTLTDARIFLRTTSDYLAVGPGNSIRGSEYCDFDMTLSYENFSYCNITPFLVRDSDITSHGFFVCINTLMDMDNANGIFGVRYNASEPNTDEVLTHPLVVWNNPGTGFVRIPPTSGVVNLAFGYNFESEISQVGFFADYPDPEYNGQFTEIGIPIDVMNLNRGDRIRIAVEGKDYQNYDIYPSEDNLFSGNGSSYVIE
ncbi:hypothetical protein JW868_00240 [Candidatus Woesearchaeota archaeon]|nr:hypothetical protein [Candidatus Woesearchaeota archaeon]